jgi:flagellar protein FliS
MCLEQVIGSLGSAVFAQDRGDNGAKSAALTRAVTALTALLMGVDNNAQAGPALNQLYDSARRSVLDSAVVFNGRRLEMIRADFTEIRQALRQSMGH